MRASSTLLPALCALVARAAPTQPQLNIHAAMPSDAMVDLSQYFNMLAQKTQEGKHMSQSPVCDLSKAELPAAFPTPLPLISPGMVLKHVAVGRGTQNYTCDTSNTTSAPAQVGAVATLFNASCIAATYPDLLNMLPRVVLAFNLSTSPAYPDNLVPAETETNSAPGFYAISGHHYFLNTTTPFFSLNTYNMQLGEAPCSKKASVSAPADAPTGQQGEKAVPWLKLETRGGATGRLHEVYRLSTAGGSPPSTCEGRPTAFEVQYSAVYWFYESP